MFLSKLKVKYLVPSALAAAVFMLTACGDGPQQKGPQGLPADILTAKTMEVPIVSTLTGRVSSTRRAEVRPQVTGIIQKRLFVEGATVQQGDQLYQIDPSLYEAQVNVAAANLKSAKASLYTVKLKADRYRSLLEKNAVSKQAYDDAQAAYLQADAAVKAAEAALETANINLAYTKVYAPISGRISKSNVTEGALVNAQQGAPLTIIQQLDPMYVDLGQTVEDHMSLRAAMNSGVFKTTDGKAPVDFFFSNGRKYEHPGQLEFSDVSVDETTGMVNLRAIVPNPEHMLLPGMFLRGDLHEGTLPKAVVIKQDAVIRESGGLSYVYTVDENNVAQRTIIKIGTEYEGFFVVSSGLKDGDRVVGSNLQKIRSGTPIIDAAAMEAAQKSADKAAK